MIAFREDRADSCFLILQCLASRPLVLLVQRHGVPEKGCSEPIASFI